MLVTEVRPTRARVHTRLQAIKSAIPEKVHKVAMNLICQLVAPMGTTFWLINFFQPTLHVEVTRQNSPQPGNKDDLFFQTSHFL